MTHVHSYCCNNCERSCDDSFMDYEIFGEDKHFCDYSCELEYLKKMYKQLKNELEDESYEDWFDRQPEEFTEKVWSEGYAEGRMQEKYGIVEFPGMIAEKPSAQKVDRMLKNIIEQHEVKKNER